MLNERNERKRRKREARGKEAIIHLYRKVCSFLIRTKIINGIQVK
jgi:hypothetical protein